MGVFLRETRAARLPARKGPGVLGRAGGFPPLPAPGHTAGAPGGLGRDAARVSGGEGIPSSQAGIFLLFVFICFC